MSFETPAKLDPKYKPLLDSLTEIQTKDPSPLLKGMIRSLELGFPQAVKNTARGQLDKLRSQPEVLNALKLYLFDVDGEIPIWEV